MSDGVGDIQVDWKQVSLVLGMCLAVLTKQVAGGSSREGVYSLALFPGAERRLG